MDVLELEIEVERTAAALNEARVVFERTNIEARDLSLVRRAEFFLTQAEQRLAKAREEAAKEAARITAKEEAELQRQARRAPPKFPFPPNGTWDRITPEAWAKFDSDMAEWKRKIREGLFDAKIW